MKKVIETVELTKKYQQGSDFVFGARNINLTIMQGELVSIVGRSGSGKSTLLNMLSGVDTPTSGRVIVADKVINLMSDKELTKFRAEHIGIIFQNYNLIAELNVLENIRLPLDLTNRPYNIDYEKELIAMLELGDRLNFRPSQLSGGQQQRVAIARALITKPDIILADEPTGNLDKKSGDAFFKFIEKTNEKYGQTYIIVTHNEDLANKTGRKISIDDGIITSDININ